MVGEEEKEPKYFVKYSLPHQNDDLIKRVDDPFNPLELQYLSTSLSPITLFLLNKPPIDLD